MPATINQPPIVVDFDGALIKSHWSCEATLQILRAEPMFLISMIRRSATALRSIKDRLAGSAADEIAYWPTNQEFVAYLAEEAGRGRQIVFATSAPDVVLQTFRRTLPFDFTTLELEDGLDAAGRANKLSSAFPLGFIYAGSSNADTPTWKKAKQRLAVNLSERDLSRLQGISFERAFDHPPSQLSIVIAEMRLHQWVKNLLIFVPLLLGGRWGELSTWLQVVVGAVGFGLTASAMYIVNDLFDLPSDRRHWSKRQRPIASGMISIRYAFGLASGFLIAGLLLMASLGSAPLIITLCYLLVTLCYSTVCKAIPILDVFVLASLYTLRLWLGIALADVRLSPWLLVFSMFVFLSLSLAKRHSEILGFGARRIEEVHGRGYRSDDAPLTLGLGLASSVVAVLILILFLIEDAFSRGQYAAPQFLWAVPPVLFIFFGRVWLLCQRGQLQDDPVAFAIADRVCIALGLAMSAVAMLAIIGIEFH